MHKYLRARLLKGVIEQVVRGSLSELRVTEWSKQFETYMRNRMLMGRYRYGPLGDPAKGLYDNIGSAKQRLQLYIDTGNQEHLADVANLCMIEFVHPNHRGAHWSPADDTDVHARPL